MHEIISQRGKLELDMRFGFLLDKMEFDCNNFSINTVPGYDDITNRFYESVRVCNGWVYGPERELDKTTQEQKKFKQRGPISCTSFYRLPSTHVIQSDLSDEEHLRFLVLGYGYLQGLYLTPDNFSYLGRTPYDPGKLNGLLLCGNDYANGMEKVNSFYESASPVERRQMFASIHWYLAGQSYEFEWEKFDAQYKVLDGIYKLSGINANCHAERPVKLAEEYHINLPKWAELDSTGKQSTLSKQRNELVHEAKYGGNPIGYSYPSENYSLEFTAFNTKLIAAALGIDMPYMQAKPDNRDQWGWDIVGN